MKVAVVYWSGTGNTEKMADCIAEGIENAGSEVEEELNGRKIALFGSYEWNEGQKWMKDWKVRCEGVGAKIVAEPLCVYDCPTPEDEDDCVAFGEKIAKA